MFLTLQYREMHMDTIWYISIGIPNLQDTI